MKSPLRSFHLFAAALLLTAGGVFAATPLPEVPKWSSSLSLQTAAGYKDNLLLSSIEPERSGFVRYGLEGFLWHLPRGQTDYSAIFNAEETRYFSSETVETESLAFAQFQWRYQIKEAFRFAFDIQGYHLDEIRDVSDTDVERLVAELKMTGIAVGPTVRWSPRPWIWLEGQGTGKREHFHDGSYNGRIGDARIRLGWKPSERFECSVGTTIRQRRFDRRSQYSLGAQPLADTRLTIREQEDEFRIDIHLDKAGRWQTSSRVRQIDYADNGPGYFDYAQRGASQSVEWKSENWLATLEGEANRREFENQTVGRGINPPQRFTEEYSAALNLERTLSSRWTVYAAYRWERSRSNETIASYRVNEGLLGARWSWEK